MWRVGLMGYGYWGPNLARVFNAHPECRLTAIADARPGRIRLAAQSYPQAACSQDDAPLIGPEVDVAVIATPVHTHFDLAKRALEHGKHVWLEKPMTASADQAEELLALAESKGLTLAVDHTFLFTGSVMKMKALIEAGELGRLYYYDSVRINLGLVQSDVNVIWDLAPHDLSIMDYLLGDSALAVSAHGRGHFDTGLEDVAYVSVFYPDNLIAHFHLNWLSPVKIRKTLVGGAKKMLVWDDLENEEKIKIYDKGADVASPEEGYGVRASYRIGDMTSPVVPPCEALQTEAAHFIDCLREEKQPINSGRTGLRIVRLLEATDRSLKTQGRVIEL